MTQTPTVLSRISALMMALALLARLLVPAGFMPMVGAGGAPALVLCTGTAPMAMPGMAGAHQRRHDPAPGHDGEHACPFGALAAAVVDAVRAPLPPLPFAAIVAATLAAVYRSMPGRGLAAPPPPKTGPPLLR